MRRVHLRGHTNIRKRLLIHTAGFNLGLLMQQLIGVGTPRGLQGRRIAVVAALCAPSLGLERGCRSYARPGHEVSLLKRRFIARSAVIHIDAREVVFCRAARTLRRSPAHSFVPRQRMRDANWRTAWGGIAAVSIPLPTRERLDPWGDELQRFVPVRVCYRLLLFSQKKDKSA